MKFYKNADLSRHSTMRLGGKAAYLVNITDKTDIPFALAWADEQKIPAMMIGGGSNIVWSDAGYPGLVMVNKIKGFSIRQLDDESSYVEIGAGENWDNAVARTVKKGLHGIEALSLIPGTAGATPVQNVGAYGQEIADTLDSVEAYDKKTKKIVTIPADSCTFGYRTSRFKESDRGRFFITSLRFILTTKAPEPPFYASLQTYLEHMNIQNPSVKTIREIVIAIRMSKLPDPAVVANNGSFFANPIISKATYTRLQKKYPHIPGWPTKTGMVKVPAAWLIETAGFKNFHDRKTGMATWHKQPLVLVNEKAEKTIDLITFRDRIIGEVQAKFKITLQQEPELIYIN